MSIIRHDGVTPAGGAYAEAITDDAGNVLEIVECAADGTVLVRHYSERFVSPALFGVEHSPPTA